MDTSRILHNTKYYDGFEFDNRIKLTAIGTTLPILHIWDGYFCFIFNDFPNDGTNWCGFTRDYQQCEGIFDSGEDQIITELQEYIDDLQKYNRVSFKNERTRGAYELLLEWFITAKEQGCKEVLVRLD